MRTCFKRVLVLLFIFFNVSLFLVPDKSYASSYINDPFPTVATWGDYGGGNYFINITLGNGSQDQLQRFTCSGTDADHEICKTITGHWEPNNETGFVGKKGPVSGGLLTYDVYPVIVVKNDDPSKGDLRFMQYLLGTGYGTYGTGTVQLANSDGVDLGGSDGTVEAKNGITGSVYIHDKSGNLVTDPAKLTNQDIVNGLIIKLTDAAGNKIGESALVYSNGSWTYSISEDIKFGIDDTYILSSSDDSDHFVDCITGKPTSSGTSGICTLKYGGLVKFMTTLDNVGSLVIVSDAEYEEINISGKDLLSGTGPNLVISESLDSPIDKALSTAVKWLSDVVESLLKWVMNAIEYVLEYTQDLVMDAGVYNAWTAIRNIALSLIMLLIIIVAFANVLQIQSGAYGLNRIIPKLAVAIISILMTWVIFNFFFEFTLILHDQAMKITGVEESQGLLSSSLGGIQINTPTTGDIVGKLGAILVIIFILFLVVACGLVLLISFIARVLILTLLLAISPLAFILAVMPFGEGLGKQWWNNFFKWMFMAPVAVLIIALGMVIASNAGLSSEAINETAVDATGEGLLIGLLILAGSLYFAAKIPLMWSGDFKEVMAGWQKFTKMDGAMNKPGEWAGGGAKWANNKFGGGLLARKTKVGSILTKQHWQDRSARVKSQQSQEFQRTQAELANTKYVGKFFTGANDMQAATLNSNLFDSYEKEGKNMSITQLQGWRKNGNEMQKLVAIKVAQDKYNGVEKLWAEPDMLDDRGNWKEFDKDRTGVFETAIKDASFQKTLKESVGIASLIEEKSPELALRTYLESNNISGLNSYLGGESRKALHQKSSGTIAALKYAAENLGTYEADPKKGELVEMLKGKNGFEQVTAEYSRITKLANEGKPQQLEQFNREVSKGNLEGIMAIHEKTKTPIPQYIKPSENTPPKQQSGEAQNNVNQNQPQGQQGVISPGQGQPRQGIILPGQPGYRQSGSDVLNDIRNENNRSQ